MRLIVVRHGETLYNVQRRFTGQSDIPLSAMGQRQAEALGHCLSRVRLDVIVASDLQRARATAQAIARYHGLPVEEDADLREIAFGAWEGATYLEVLARDPVLVQRWESDPTFYAPPGGETVAQLRERVKWALERWRGYYPTGTALWAVHGGVIEVLLCHLLGIDLRRRWDFRQDNASITEVDLGSKGTVVVRLNDTEHLLLESTGVKVKEGQPRMHDKRTLDDLAGTYNRRLVVALKSERTLTSPMVEDAFISIPRHAFIDHYYVHNAAGAQAEQWRRIGPPAGDDVDGWLEGIYANVPLVTAFDEAGLPGSSSSAPGIMAFMLEALQLRPGMRVLEIGTGTGYNAALLAHIVRDPQLVFSVELDPSLAYSAQEKIDPVVGRGTTVHAGNGLDGYNAGAPYDRIIATGSYHKVAPSWLDQLKEGAVLVMNLGRDRAAAMGILQLEKVGPKREARGRFLSPAHFLQLREPGQPPGPNALSQFSRYARSPVAAKLSISRAVFDPALLMDMQFAFLVSCELPYSSLTWIARQEDIPFTLNLIDTESETIVQFRTTEEAGVWEVQVKGAVQTWERLFQAYEKWVGLGRPKMTDYVFEVDDEGGQFIKMPGIEAGGRSAMWVIG